MQGIPNLTKLHNKKSPLLKYENLKLATKYQICVNAVHTKLLNMKAAMTLMKSN